MSEVPHALLLFFDLFVALTAIGGGVALIAGLEGTRYPTEVLSRTPFRSFLVPGLILAVVVGGSAVLATVQLITNREMGGLLSIVAGALLGGFIAVEVAALNDEPGWSTTELVYLAIGVVMVGLGVVVWIG
ncbi:MAG: hypothetical protein O3A10_11800 [Chloroflexi bacterium]|nr:hypothetical protein [Chloroflexota bacterium]MDA1147202.1 hypothetical protein [Chloroflexota bacterium]